MTHTKYLKYGLFGAVILLALISTAILLLRIWQSQSHSNDYGEFESRVMRLERDVVKDKISMLTSDINYLTYTYNLYEKTFADEGYKKLEDNWTVFLHGREIYFKLRYIDADGMESIKINFSKARGPSVSPAWVMDRKSDRYYFQAAMKLLPDQIYMSKLDLDVENGGIAKPYMLVIRIASAVYSDKGEPKGIVVLSCDAEDFFKEFKELARTSSGETYLVDSDGHWVLRSESGNFEWGPLYNDSNNYKTDFAGKFPEVWKEILQNNVYGEGGISTSKGMFVYIASPPYGTQKTGDGKTLLSADGPMTLITFVPNDYSKGLVFSQNAEAVINYAFGGIGVFHIITSVLFGMILVLILIVHREREKNKYYKYDTLSHAYSRGFGLKKLRLTYFRMIRMRKRSSNGANLSVCFIDINGLKKINDTFGHEAGDRLIVQVVKTVTECISDSDFIIRLGGDEFLIIFVGYDTSHAEEVWHEISLGFEKINRDHPTEAPISVSHGLCGFSFENGETVDSVINIADEMMYAEKRIMHAKTKWTPGNESIC